MARLRTRLKIIISLQAMELLQEAVFMWLAARSVKWAIAKAKISPWRGP